MKHFASALAIVALLGPAPASADCAPVPLPQEIERSDVIFVGTVSSVTDRRVTFRIEQIFKGQVGRSVSAVMNPMRFYVGRSAIGRRFVIFMRRQSPGQLTVNGCGSSQTGPEVPRIVRALRAAGLRPHRPAPVHPPG